jgi:hypothetical protein
MPGLTETLTTQAGPLPVWAWAGLGTAGLAGYLIYRKKKAATTAAQQAANQNPMNTSGPTVTNASTLGPLSQTVPLPQTDYTLVAMPMNPGVNQQTPTPMTTPSPPTNTMAQAPPPAPSPATTVGTGA